MRTPLVVGNWKMNLHSAAALTLVTELKNQLAAQRGVTVAVAPPSTALWPVARRLEDSVIEVAGQNCHWEDKGAFTGEVAASMLRDAGCKWVILGHSERRAMFGDTNEAVGRKVAAARAAALGAILCVGETLSDRDAGRTLSVIDEQLRGGLSGAGDGGPGFVVAYEPVWAIGTGRTATPAQAQEVHAHIRSVLATHWSAAVASATRILYGGSVKADNAAALMGQPDIDGALVGGASLVVADFVAIVRAARP